MEPAYKFDYQVDLESKKRYVAKNKSRHRRVPAPVLICVAAVLFVSCAIFYIGQQVTSMHLNICINNYEERLAELKQEQGYLIIELEQVSRLEYIEAVARRDMGMVDPVNAEMLVMNAKDAVGSEGKGWVAVEDDKNNNLFMTVANWLNKWLPTGGVEAGRIGQ